MVRPPAGNQAGSTSRTAPASTSGGGDRTVPGPDAIAGAALTTQALARTRVNPDAVAQVIKVLGDLLPGHPVRAGSAAADRTVPADTLTQLIPSAAIVAAGLDPAKTALPVPAVVWTSGANTLLVKPAGVKAALGAGTVDITVPVTCDQTGDTTVTVTFMTGTPDRPAGGIVTTEDHPRGPAIVVENWAEPLVAFAWHTLVVATDALSGGAGGDVAGHDLVTAALGVTKSGLGVTPMGRHAFPAGGLTS